MFNDIRTPRLLKQKDPEPKSNPASAEGGISKLKYTGCAQFIISIFLHCSFNYEHSSYSLLLSRLLKFTSFLTAYCFITFPFKITRPP